MPHPGKFSRSTCPEQWPKYVDTNKLFVIRSLGPNTRDGYLQFMKSKNIHPDEYVKPGVGTLLFLGPRDAELYVLYFHGKDLLGYGKLPGMMLLKIPGGGYVMPATTSHFSFLYDLRNSVQAMGKSVTFILLPYSMHKPNL